MEYFLHLLNIINRTEHGAAERLGGASLPPTLSAFTYLVRLPCFLLTAEYTSVSRKDAALPSTCPIIKYEPAPSHPDWKICS